MLVTLSISVLRHIVLQTRCAPSPDRGGCTASSRITGNMGEL